MDSTLNLSRTFEAQLLNLAGRPRTTPAVVVTGALGAGKTSLLQHLLHNRGNLRFAVVVNELAGTDVDSALLGSGQANAVVGCPALSVTSSCCCCQGTASLRKAVSALLSSDDGCCDLLLVETTGVADPAPCAGILASAGIEVSCIVTVVDAESITTSLASSPTARLQVAAADVVVINKCDLVTTLADVSRAEDAVRSCNAHGRLVRSRHGAVPLSSLLDVHVDDDGAAVQAFVGVVSHEQARPSSLLRLPASQRAAAGPFSLPRPEHMQEVGGIFTGTFVSDASPLCAAALRRVLARHMRCGGLLRVKGDVWFAQRPRARHVLHLSGRMRLSVTEPSPAQWEGPPGTRLVLIGTQAGALHALCQDLEAMSPSALPEDDVHEVAAQLASSALDTTVVDGPSVLLSFRGNPRFGVDGHALNASLLARANASGDALLVGIQGCAAPGGGLLAGLLYLPGCALAADVRRHADDLLRTALAHIPTCDC